MKIEQVVTKPCALCVLISQAVRLTKRERLIYQKHLQLEHHLVPYYIPR